MLVYVDGKRENEICSDCVIFVNDYDANQYRIGITNETISVDKMNPDDSSECLISTTFHELENLYV